MYKCSFYKNDKWLNVLKFTHINFFSCLVFLSDATVGPNYEAFM